MAMDSKLVLIIGAVVVIGGGLLAVRNLTGPGSGGGGADDLDRETEIVSSGDSSAGRLNLDEDTEITTRDSDNSRDKRRAPVQRKFHRGVGAAAIDVTPATTTPLQAATLPVSTPVVNVTEEMKAENRQIADLGNLFRSQTNSEDRIDTADELGLIDNPNAVRTMLELLAQEKDPAVQVALLEGMQSLEALEGMTEEVFNAATEVYTSTDDPDVKIAAQDLLGDLATAEAARALRNVRASASDPREKLNAAENLMRINAANPDAVPRREVEELNVALQQDYQSGPDAAYRSQAIMALAIKGQENVEFFQQALQTEQDQQLRQLLERLVRVFSAPPPEAPPPGTVVTPVPVPPGMEQGAAF